MTHEYDNATGGGEHIEYRFRIIQDGQPIAGASGFHKPSVDREMRHYAMVYGQDGPVTIETKTGKERWRKLP